MRSCFLKLFEIDVFLSHSNQPSSLQFKLIDWFLYEGNIGFKFIKIYLFNAGKGRKYLPPNFQIFLSKNPKSKVARKLVM